MKAVVLAAGCGKRLAALDWYKPKSLLKFGGQTLLENIIASLLDNGINRACFVLGYKKDLILEVIRKYHIQYDIVINKNYTETNTINSLYLAKEYLDDDFICFNADVLFEKRIVSELLVQSGNVFAIEVKKCRQEEVKVIVGDGNRIVGIGKDLDPSECLGEYIGIGKFSRSTSCNLIHSLCRYNEELNERQQFYETAIADILDKHEFLAWPIGHLLAIEIDTPQDYEKAKRLWEEKGA